MREAERTPQHSLRVLLELTRTLAEEQPLESSLRAITDTVLAMIPADHASVRLLDANHQYLLCGARSGSGSTIRPMRFASGEGVIGWCVSQDQPVYTRDAHTDPRFAPATTQGFSVRSILAEPLRSGGKVVGVLSASAAKAEAFTDEHQLLCRLLANCSIPPIERVRLERLALTDDTTLAFNVRYLFPKLAEEIALAKRNLQPLSILLMDLDRFKRVNDELGHPVGDGVLRHFANSVRAQVRRCDVLVRRGGEEFVLIMPSTTNDNAARTAERIRESLAAAPILLSNGSTIHQTVSIGVATWDGFEAPDALDQRADAAMYSAKEAGRNRVALAPQAMHSPVAEDPAMALLRKRSFTNLSVVGAERPTR